MSKENKAQVLDGRRNPFYKKSRALYEQKVPAYLRTECRDASLVYDILCNYAGYTNRECFISYKRIMSETGIGSRSTISTSLDVLSACNLISVEKRIGDGGMQDTSLYTILDEDYWQIPDPSTWRVRGGTRSKSKGENKGDKPSPPPVHEIETDQERRKEKQSSAVKPRNVKSSSSKKKAKQPRKRDLLFEEVAHLMTGEVYSPEWNNKHKLKAGQINRTVKHLRELGVTPEEIAAVRVEYDMQRGKPGSDLPYLSSPNTIAARVDAIRNKPAERTVQHVATSYIQPPKEESIF